MTKNYISPIAIDLGAKFTGVALYQYLEGADCTQEVAKGLLVDDRGNVTWSQEGRRGKRHQVRGYKRRKMAKRLLWLILDSEYGIKREEVTEPLLKFINGLLNRRGYTYISEEVDEESMNVSPLPFSEMMPDYFNSSAPLLEQLAKLLSDKNKLVRFRAEGKIPSNKNEFKKLLDTALDGKYKDEKKELSEAWGNILIASENVLKSTVDGHKSRSEYLANIKEDIKSNEELEKQISSKEIDGFYNLVGHLSNFQLRLLRKYFNDPNMSGVSYWDEKRLEKYFYQWVQGWHTKGGTDEAEKKNIILKTKGAPLLKTLKSLSADLTIPPYEDQNNRRPPKCQSVLLSDEKLTMHYPKWKEWVGQLVKQNDNAYLNENVTLANALHRIVERSRSIDPYQLRLLISITDAEKRNDLAGYKRLKLSLGSEVDEFLLLVKNIVDETKEAREGLWFETENKLFFKCGKTPPRKEKLKSTLLSAVLGKNLSDDEQSSFIEEFWKSGTPKIERRNVRGWCRLASQVQKTYGVYLKEYGLQQLHKLEAGKKLDDKPLALLYKNSGLIASKIGEALNIEPDEVSRFASPHSLAQIFNIIEGDVAGFNKTCRACTYENIWRMQEEKVESLLTNQLLSEIHGERKVPLKSAMCTRLSADSTRPFDGQMASIIEHIARKIAQHKIAQINDVPKEFSIDIPIIIESNQFSFTAELEEIKRGRGSAKAKKAKELGEKSKAGWVSKTERIKTSSEGICPYTGAPLGGSGEIDHIIPRSLTGRTKKTVFNSEANLIYCSSKGNHDKGNRVYVIEQLNDKYLKKQFSTSDVNLIKKKIKTTIQRFTEGGEKLRSFSELSREDQKAFRHALFVPELKSEVTSLLAVKNITRVNGTQAWLAKKIASLLAEHLDKQGRDYTLSAHQIDPWSVSKQRKMLASAEPIWAKKDPQPAASHVVDAVCTFLEALEQPHTASRLKTISSTSFEKTGWRSALIPDLIKVDALDRRPKYRRYNIGSTSLFKDGIYAERFLPILIDENGLMAGYDIDNSLKAKGADVVFESLSPFLLFKGEEVGAQSLSDWQERIDGRYLYMSIDKVKAFDYLQEKVGEKDIAAELLNSIHFTQRKTELRAKFSDDSGKKMKTLDAIRKSLKLTVTVNEIGKRKEKCGFSGTIGIPAKSAWENLLDEPLLETYWGTKMPPQEIWEKVYRKHFPRNIPNQAHRKVRKDFSLPVVDSVSGGFRVKRKTPNGYNYQLLAIDGYSAVGFKKEGDNVDFKSPALVPQIAESKSVTPISSELVHLDKNEIVYFDEWRKIDISDSDLKQFVSSLELAPGSQNRFYIRFTVDEDQFERHFKSALRVNGIQDLDTVNKTFDWNREIPSLLIPPRSNLFLLETGQKITFEYIANGANAEVKKAYSLRRA
ncbi:CRISPR-associated large protein (provisional), putative [gamma proteobacterium HTCC5015]|nr:CRISPR-associated large protein (provisional), putative [gamma proteobacterium HTCC5015]